jgi:hypothetical protein
VEVEGSSRANNLTSSSANHLSGLHLSIAMRRSALEHICLSCRSSRTVSRLIGLPSRRYVQISATPSEPQQSLEPKAATSGPTAGTFDGSSEHKIARSDILSDARFEVLGSPFSLLSASISASQALYTRKGTLVGFSGRAENVRDITICGKVNTDVFRLSLRCPSSSPSEERCSECHSYTSA